MERTIVADGVELCVESFGDRAHPPVLLVMGIGASMLWWDERFCRTLADAGRFVIRYDHRDTGRSTSDPPGRPSYGGGELVRDAVRVLDGEGVDVAHVVGVSAGGAIAQLLALDVPRRVASLVLVSTSPATAGDRTLAPATDAYRRFASTAVVDWDDPDSVIEHLVASARVLAGDGRPFDEAAARSLVRADVARTRRVASLQNHDLLADDEVSRASIGSIGVPTLVIHGSRDPMFPLDHGVALAREIPDATLLTLEGAGHGLDPADRDVVAGAVLAHTARAVGGVPTGA